MRNDSKYRVGNYVLVNGQPVQIAAVHDKKIGVHIKERSGRLYWVRIPLIEHIPLTTEFLEKNGFSVVDEGLYFTCWRDFDHGHSINVYIYDEESRGIEIEIDLDSWNVNTCAVEYIHEFQNLLSVCGYKEKIKL